MSDHYRRRWGEDEWHFCVNCPEWPTARYDSRATKPDAGETCEGCVEKHDDDTCDHAWLDGPAV